MRRKDDEKEQRIRDAVIDVVLEEGFGGASISKIAKAAGVAPATVYIYHANKEAMLRSIYLDCAEEVYDAVLCGVQEAPDGPQKIERLIRNYFAFITQHARLFAFVEQFASSPALTHNCAQIKGFERTTQLIEQWKARGLLRPYDTINIMALLFHPVKMLASGAITYHVNAEPQLKELIAITQAALLV